VRKGAESIMKEIMQDSYQKLIKDIKAKDWRRVQNLNNNKIKIASYNKTSESQR
jgi:hypothetical protein